MPANCHTVPLLSCCLLISGILLRPLRPETFLQTLIICSRRPFLTVHLHFVLTSAAVLTFTYPNAVSIQLDSTRLDEPLSVECRLPRRRALAGLDLYCTVLCTVTVLVRASRLECRVEWPKWNLSSHLFSARRFFSAPRSVLPRDPIAALLHHQMTRAKLTRQKMTLEKRRGDSDSSRISSA